MLPLLYIACLQVDKRDSAITLDPKAGERAILIKNHHGDWAVIIGRWQGVKKGISGVKGLHLC